MPCTNSPANQTQRPRSSRVTPINGAVVARNTAAEGGAAREVLTLEQLKEVRELCRNRAENGSFLTLAALIACFSLGVLPTLKYDDKYYDVLNYAFSAQNLTKATPTEGCDPCAWLIEEGGTFLNHTLLAYTPRRYSSG